jgi:DNA-binding transcriptional ArsR family regulator
MVLEFSMSIAGERMQLDLAIASSALAALGHETRLAVFRLLVQAGEGGVQPGRLAEVLDLPASSLSFHLMHLQHAGLITSRREGRGLIYTTHYDMMEALMGYLQENCCRGITDGCAPVRQRARSRAKAEA